MIIPPSLKMKISFKRLPSVYAGQRGIKPNNILYAIVDNQDGRRIGELDLTRNVTPWEYIEKFAKGKKAQYVLYLITALDTPALLEKLKAQYASNSPDTAAFVQLPDGTRIPYYLSSEANYSPEDVSIAVLKALNALMSEAPSCHTAVSGRLNAMKQQQAQLHALEIDINFEKPGGLWDNVMKKSTHHAILHAFASDPNEQSAPVVILGSEFGRYSGPVRFVRGAEDATTSKP